MDTEHHTHIEDVIAAHGEYLIRMAFMYVKDWPSAEDIVQETFISYFKNLHKFQNRSTVKTYLTRIMINKCHDHLRSWKNKKQLFTQLFNHLPAKNSTPEEWLIKTDEQSELVSEILKLSVKYREVILLYYYQELTTLEISVVLKCPENTVKTRLSRARLQLKNHVDLESREVWKIESH